MGGIISLSPSPTTENSVSIQKQSSKPDLFINTKSSSLDDNLYIVVDKENQSDTSAKPVFTNTTIDALLSPILESPTPQSRTNLKPYVIDPFNNNRRIYISPMNYSQMFTTSDSSIKTKKLNQMHQKVIEEETYTCAICKISFSTVQEYTEHIQFSKVHHIVTLELQSRESAKYIRNNKPLKLVRFDSQKFDSQEWKRAKSCAKF